MLVKDMIFRVHTLKVLEIGPGFNSVSPHRRMRSVSEEERRKKSEEKN
jgi:hypothetical protein